MRHVIRWVCFHNILWTDRPLAALILVDVYIGAQKENCHLVNFELLKDTCGCLITFTYNEELDSECVAVVYYTV